MARKRIYSDRFNKVYKTYRKRYFSKKRQFEKLNRENIRKGEEIRYQMRDKVMTKSDFFSTYKAYKEELRKEGIKNPNVVQYIVSDQAYSRSRKQFRALKAHQTELREELGLDISKLKELEFRTGNEDIDWDILKKEYYYLKDEYGMTAAQAKSEIAYLYFGSE